MGCSRKSGGLAQAGQNSPSHKCRLGLAYRGILRSHLLRILFCLGFILRKLRGRRKGHHISSHGTDSESHQAGRRQSIPQNKRTLHHLIIECEWYHRRPKPCASRPWTRNTGGCRSFSAFPNENSTPAFSPDGNQGWLPT